MISGRGGVISYCGPPYTWVNMTHAFPSFHLPFKILLTNILSVQCMTQAGQSSDQSPNGARHSAPIRTSPEAHPAFYAMRTRSFPCVKQPMHGPNHPTPPSTEIKKNSVFTAGYRVNFTYTYTYLCSYHQQMHFFITHIKC